MCAWCSWRPEKDKGASGNGATGGCELLGECGKWSSVLLIVKSSLQALKSLFLDKFYIELYYIKIYTFHVYTT